MKLLFRLLRQNLNAWQLSGFVVANIVGAVIILFGLQAYRDVAGLLNAPDGFMKSNYLVLSKPISALSAVGNLLGVKQTFTESEMKAIALQPGVAAVGAFTSSQFEVYGVVEMAGARMATEMFLESVPDTFLDIAPTDWSATVEGAFVPVIIPRTYLNLYNYGFASSRGLPQLGEGMMRSFPFRLRLTGAGLSRWYDARIVGFSNRLNTILVPDAFLKEANARFAGSVDSSRSDSASAPVAVTSSAPMRIIVEAGGRADDVLTRYIADRHYTVEGTGADNMRMLSLARGVMWVLVSFGSIVSLLAFFLLLISILLLIEKNRDKIATLLSLGYTVQSVALPYQVLALALDVAAWLVAWLVVSAFYPAFLHLLASVSPGFVPSGGYLLPLSALACCLLFSALHLLAVWRKAIEMSR